jgi:hypothetical protein
MPVKKLDSGACDIRATSRLRGSRSQVWAWIVSVAGISEEMSPYFRMTSPEGVQSLTDLKVELGVPFLRSRVFLFGFIPAGTWDFTLVEFEDGKGFVEQSLSTFMTSWRSIATASCESALLAWENPTPPARSKACRPRRDRCRCSSSGFEDDADRLHMGSHLAQPSQPKAIVICSRRRPGGAGPLGTSTDR